MEYQTAHKYTFNNIRWNFLFCKQLLRTTGGLALWKVEFEENSLCSIDNPQSCFSVGLISGNYWVLFPLQRKYFKLKQ